MRIQPRGFSRASSRESGQVIVLLLVLLAVVGGGWWFLKSNRDMREREARAFANETAARVVQRQDRRYLDFNFTQKAQLTYPPSWRMRMIDLIKEQGTPPAQFGLKGDVLFKNQFFEPTANFIAQFDYPNGPAFLEMHISHPGALWVIDDINWTWTPAAPTPTPPLIPIATPTPTPTPSPSPSPSRSKRR